MDKNYIQHHGTKGMKWGVRRYQNPDGSLTPAGKKRYDRNADREVRKSRKHDSKNRRLLGDQDLDKKIGRIKKEKELKKLTEEDIAPGRSIAKSVLISAGTAAATTMVAGAIKYGVKVAMTKKFDLEEAAGFIVPKPKK